MIKSGLGQSNTRETSNHGLSSVDDDDYYDDDADNINDAHFINGDDISVNVVAVVVAVADDTNVDTDMFKQHTGIFSVKIACENSAFRDDEIINSYIFYAKCHCYKIIHSYIYYAKHHYYWQRSAERH